MLPCCEQGSRPSLILMSGHEEGRLHPAARAESRRGRWNHAGDLLRDETGHYREETCVLLCLDFHCESKNIGEKRVRVCVAADFL
ncbi:hypothetical protein INR49_005334 [Caranx melampygus]|nr:hypothetical protein INR49_005334 [Caranx melampygus]